MGLPFSIGSEVSYAGARWRVARVLGADAILLCSDSGDEVAADPLRVTFLDAPALGGPATGIVDEMR